MSFNLTIGDHLSDYSDRLESFFDGSFMGASTGLHDLDQLMYGLHEGKLYVVGARPAMGKSALMLLFVYTVAVIQRRPVALFSLEMDQVELTERLACMDAKIDSQRLKRGDLNEAEWARFSHSFARLCDAPIWVEDNPHLDVQDVEKRLLAFKEEMGDLGLVAIDYVQLMSGEGESRQNEVSKISRQLKILARSVEAPVVALSQLSRALELRVDKRPQLADLRESGAIEQDADAVMFIYRDEVYQPDTADKGIAEIIVAKHRGGPNGTVKAAWLAHCTRFANLAKFDD